MARIKEGFKGEKVVSLPEDLLQTYSKVSCTDIGRHI